MLQARAVNARTELQALAHRVRAREAAHELARQEYFPDFTVMGTYNSLWEQTEQQWLVGAGINIPLQLGRRSAAVDQTLAERDRLRAELVAGVDKVAFEVTDAYDRVVESEHVVSLYKSKVVPAAEENLKAARSGYENGKNDFLALLTAEKNLMITQLEYQQALTVHHQSLADLERSIGAEITQITGEGDSNDE